DGNRFLVWYLEGPVDLKSFEIGSDTSLADAFGDRTAFGLELPGRLIAEERRAGRIGEADDDIGFPFAKCLGNPRKRAAGADRANESVDLAVSLFPDFGAGSFDVRLAVGDIVELVGPDGAVLLLARQSFCHAAGDFHVIVGVTVGYRRNLDQVGTKGA